MSEAEMTEAFELSGGALCLDLANTLGDRPRSNQEHLGDIGDLLRFSRQAEVVDADQLDELEREAEAHPGRAQAIFERALELRETIYRIFAALARGERPPGAEIASLNSVLHEALPHLEVRSRPQGFEWAWNRSRQSLDRILWPVARSAADLLTSEEADAVGECDSETCSWLFVDRSRTGQRRWCDMATCGNRAKARRHYQRRKQSRHQ